MRLRRTRMSLPLLLIAVFVMSVYISFFRMLWREATPHSSLTVSPALLLRGSPSHTPLPSTPTPSRILKGPRPHRIANKPLEKFQTQGPQGMALPVMNMHTHMCVGWRQTAKCDPDESRQVQFDKNCDALIEDGLSGYCECEGGRKARGLRCEHLPFTCALLCDPNEEAAFFRRLYQKAVVRPVLLGNVSSEELALNQPRPNLIPVGDDIREQEQLDRLSKGEVPARPLYETASLEAHIAHLKDVVRRAGDR